MSEAASVYAQALYDLAKEEKCTQSFADELRALQEGIAAEPQFLKLLSIPNISKDERCKILDTCFGAKVHPYVLNFLKLLTQKGHIRQFSKICNAYRSIYNHDHGILEITAHSAIALNESQKQRLTEKLAHITGKSIDLTCRIDPACLGGIRLDYDGKCMDGTVQNRLDGIRRVLKNTVL